MAHVKRIALVSRITTGLLVCTLISTSIFAQGGAVPTTSDTWHRVQHAPVGVRMRLTLKNGSKVAGTVADAGADSVTLEHNSVEEGFFTLTGGTTRDDRITFQRPDVVAAEALTTRHRATGSPFDAEIVRFVVTGLDVGGKVVVRTADQRFGGRIQSIGEDSFTIIGGAQSHAEELRYRDVREVNWPRMSRAGRAAMWSGITVGAFLGLGLVGWYRCGCD